MKLFSNNPTQPPTIKGASTRRWMFSAWLLFATIALLTLCTKADWGLIKHRTVNKHIVGELGRIGYLVHELFQAGKMRLSDARLGTIDTEQFRVFIENTQETNQQSKPAVSGQTKHLIYLQMESVDGVSLQSSYNGKPLMPFLHRLKRQKRLLH